MRNANLYNQPDSVKYPSIFPYFLDIPEEEKRLAAYITEARFYLITHMSFIKMEYATYILKQLREQYLMGHEIHTKVSDFGSIGASKIIEKYILSYGDMLVLCNPEGDPCVVVDAYAFTDFDIEAFEERMLVEYIQNNPNPETSPYSAFSKKAMIRAAKFGGGYGMSKLGTFLTKSGDRLSLLSKHYASGHKTTMRIQKSFRGNKAQRDALMKLIKKSTKYGKSGTQKIIIGTVLKKLASNLKKGAFRPVTIFDALKVWDGKTPTAIEASIATIATSILSELRIYCERNNNYQFIINQQYFDNAN